MVWIVSWALSARAESWCARPLRVHEWGVTLLRADGASVTVDPLPAWFHRAPTGGEPPGAVPVRQMPADTGIRKLPVIQVYGAGDSPLALDVAFAHGDPLAWFPAVDQHQTGATARSNAAIAGHAQLVAARAAHTRTSSPMPADPARQLGWDVLFATTQPEHPPHPIASGDPDWIASLRAMPDALWLRRGTESDRFVFYEGTTHAPPALRLEHTTIAGRQVTQLRNVSDRTVHDVVWIANGLSATVPAIPAGATAVATLAPSTVEQLEAWLGGRWTEPGAKAPIAWDPGTSDCVMMRDPAVPVDRAGGYRLFADEVALLFDVWSEEMLRDPAPHVIYREDIEALDISMPLSVFTDMYHHVELRRLGIVVVGGLDAQSAPSR